MYPGQQAVARAEQPAVVMGRSGQTVTYRRTRGARQSARASVARPRPEASRPFRRVHGKPCALRRVRRGGRAGGTLLHQRQFLPDAPRTRLYRQQQPLQGADHLAGKARYRAGGAARLPRRRTLPDRRRPRDRDRVRNLDDATAPYPETPIADECARRGDALFLGNDRQSQGRACARYRCSRPRSPAP